jgi:hypothetical protein
MEPEKKPEPEAHGQAQTQAQAQTSSSAGGDDARGPGEAYTAMPDFRKRGRGKLMAAILAAALALGAAWLHGSHRAPATQSPGASAQLGQ